MSVAVFIVDAIRSHLFASIGVARRLERRGWKVEYWGIARNGSDALVREQGFPFRTLDGLWSRYQDDIRVPTDLTPGNLLSRMPDLMRRVEARRERWRTMAAAIDRFATALDAAIADTRPAFAIVDPFLLAYYPLLWQRNLPTVALSTKPLPTADPLVPPYDSWLIPSATAWGRARVQHAWVRPRLLDLQHRANCRIARGVHVYTYSDILRECARRTAFPLEAELVSRWVQPDLHFRSVHEWALWTADTDLPRQNPLPSNVRFIGPSVDRRRFAGSSPTGFHDARARHRVYVAVGTVKFRWKDNVPFLRKVLEALGGLEDVSVVMSTGDERTTAALGSPPANVQLFDFLPQLQMLETSDLAITHAGAGTYRECVELAVPMLAYPRNHDQIGNSSRIIVHGLGLRGDRTRDTADQIRSKTRQILGDPSYRVNIQRLRRLVHASEERLLGEALVALTGRETALVGAPSQLEIAGA